MSANSPTARERAREHAAMLADAIINGRQDHRQATDAIALALTAAEQRGEERMRERCAVVAETYMPPARSRPTIAELEAILNAPDNDERVRIEPDGSVVVGITSGKKIAAAIRALAPEEPVRALAQEPEG